MSSTWRVRDPVHGFIELTEKERGLLDSLPLQRLRSIHQLALAFHVYPGALHRRFDHTLGVTEVAGRMCGQLGIPEEHVVIIRLAALLHDVGHGPFSHVSESVLESVNPGNLPEAAGKQKKIHELVGQWIILESPHFEHWLSGSERLSVAQLLRDGWESRCYRDLVSGPLDADKQDYLLRDSYFCGAQYGVYDLRQLHYSLTRTPVDGDEVLAVEEGGLHSLEQYVLAKYYLTTQIYRHKVRLITDAMLARALTLGVVEDEIGFLDAIYRCPLDGSREERASYLERYLEWWDDRVIAELLRSEHEHTQAGLLFRRLARRQLLKRVFHARLAELPVEVRTRIPKHAMREQARPELEAEIAEKLRSVVSGSIDSRHVIVNYYKIDSVREESRNDERAVPVVSGPGRVSSLEEESTLFKSIDAEMNDEIVECYAPVVYTEEREKRRILDEVSQFVVPLMQKSFAAVAPMDQPPDALKGGPDRD